MELVYLYVRKYDELFSEQEFLEKMDLGKQHY